jgi:Zn-dependent protease with chaperone function
MKRLGMGQIVLLATLIGILILTAVWATSVWNTGDAVMDKHGWIALGLGTFFSLVVGCGLMALMFFSSRSGHDEAADPFRRKQEPPNSSS